MRLRSAFFAMVCSVSFGSLIMKFATITHVFVVLSLTRLLNVECLHDLMPILGFSYVRFRFFLPSLRAWILSSPIIVKGVFCGFFLTFLFLT